MNVPIYRTNRKLVATKNGGLENPSPLVFNPSWNREVPRAHAKRFKYPSVSGVRLPTDEEDIAFMSVSHLFFFFSLIVGWCYNRWIVFHMVRECFMAGS